MASLYTVGFGSAIYYSADGTTYTKIAQSRDLKGPNPEVGDIKLTNNDSPNNTKEYAPGMIEPGEIDFELVYDKAQAATLYAMFGDGLIHFWREVYADGSKWEFKGYIKKFGTETKTEDEANTTTVTIKLTNKPVFTAAA